MRIQTFMPACFVLYYSIFRFSCAYSNVMYYFAVNIFTKNDPIKFKA